MKFLSAPGLALQADLEKTKVISDILTDIYMLLMVEKGVRGGICHSTYRYAKANNKYMEDCDKNKRIVIYSYLYVTVWNVFKYGVFSGPYFPVFRPNAGEYGPEKAPYLGTFHIVCK